MAEFDTVVHLTGTVVDTEGKGVAGVSVTNAELVTQTGEDGAFEIEVRTGVHRILMVTVPSGYASVDGFARRLSGEVADGITFTLRRLEDAGERFAVAHITDLHVQASEDGEAGKLRDGYVSADNLAADLAAIKEELAPDFVLATGDLTEGGSTAQLRTYRATADASGLSIYAGFGMHDANDMLWHRPGDPLEPGGEINDYLAGSAVANTLTGYFETIVGPTYYSFDRGDWHFVHYPNEHYAFSLYDQVRKERWLDADLALAEGRPVVIGTHMPPRLEWLERVSARGVRLVLHGHVHSSKVYRYRDILIASTPALGWGGLETNPRGYRAIGFDGARFDMELRSVGERAVSAKPPRALATGAGDAPNLRLAWETELPAHTHRAAPVPFEDDLLVSLQDEDEGVDSGVCRVRREDGSIVWYRRTDSAVRGSVAVAGDGALFAMSFCGRLSRLEATTGETVWDTDTPGFPERFTATTPVVADGAVYIGAKSGYGAYDVGTGQELWFRRFSGTLDLPADHIGDKWGSYYKPVIFGELLITLVSRRSLMALQRATGRIVWERPLPNCQDYWASPLLAGERVISSGESEHMLAVRAGDGVDLWHERVLEDHGFDSDYATGLLVSGDRIYAGACDGDVIACDLDSGQVLWRFRTGPNVLDMAASHRGIRTVLAPPVLYDGRIVVCGVDAVVYMMNPESGECEAQTPFEAPITAPPIAVDDGLYVATWDGTLRRFGQE